MPPETAPGTPDPTPRPLQATPDGEGCGGRGVSSFPPPADTPSPLPPLPPRTSGRLVESVGGVYRVLVDPPSEGPEEAGGEEAGAAEPLLLEAFLRGRLKQEVRTGDRLVAGDRVVLVRGEDDTWTIEAVEPRRSELVRAGIRGRKAKVVAANVDEAVVVVSALRPDLRPDLLDRFLALAELSGIPPTVVINKIDLEGAAGVAHAVEQRLAPAGYPVLRTSVPTGEGVEALRARLAGRTSVILGPSGAGKSSLLNAVAPGLELRTGTVSRRKGGGRHTTVSARLVLLPGAEGGWVVDTPGFSDVSAFAPERSEVALAYPEFAERAGDCRFRGCSHLHEPGCAVQAAAEVGEIHPGRLSSYRRLVEACLSPGE